MAKKKTTKKNTKRTAKLRDTPKAKKSLIAIIAILFGGIGTFMLVNSLAAPGGANLIGVVQPAAAQTTTTGKSVVALHEWRGRIYTGFGDYSANTGPISITSYDTTTRQFVTEGSAATEAIYIYRELGGKLFAPAIDSRGADLAFADAPGQWENVSGVGTTHAYDMTELGGMLWMSGSVGKIATVWSSADGGNTWQTSLSIPGSSPTVVARFYFIATYQGKIYVQAAEGGSPQNVAYAYDPTTASWNPAPAITIHETHFAWGRKPLEFNGYLLLLENESLSGPSGIIKYDGTARTTENRYTTSVGGGVYYDYTISDGYLYGLRFDGTVGRTKDLVVWENVATGPKENRYRGAGRSIAVFGSKIYLGTYDSKLYELPISVQTKGGRR